MNTLFLGNGINQLAGIAPSWNDLLSDITEDETFAAPDSLLMTLGFELFVQRYLDDHTADRETDIKRKISQKLLEKQKVAMCGEWSSDVHRRLMNGHPQEILTTNYDYFLELTLDHKFKPGRTSTNEKLYSMHRYREVNGIRIYHIHGEISAANSICLGYEQYTGSVQYIRDVLCRSCGKKKGEFHLAKVLRNEELPIENTWYYAFFHRNMDMLGFGLDTSELDIWWLLNYRAKLMREYPDLIRNTITYYETDDFTQPAPLFTDPKLHSEFLQKRKHLIQKRELLEAFRVNYVLCPGISYSERYDYALQQMGV